MFSRVTPAAWLAAALLLLALTGCAQKQSSAHQAVVVIPFEDLSPERRGFPGEGVAWLAVRCTQGDSGVRVVEASSASNLFPARTISGWLQERNGVLDIHGQVRDEETQRVIRSFRLTGSRQDLPKLAAALAEYTGAQVRQTPPINEQALELFLAARNSASLKDALPLVNQSIAADPAFAPAYLLKADLLARLGDAAGRSQTLTQARSAKLTDVERAQVDLAEAQERRDFAAQSQALTRLAQLQGSPAPLLRELLDVQFITREFHGAAETASRILAQLPGDDDALNRRGYALAFAGDLDGARRAFAEYQEQRPESANAIDSLGEVLFYFGRFAEASKQFMEAGRKDPSLLNGAESFRAALSAFLAGDAAQADQLYALYRASRKSDPLLGVRDAIWARMTRRNPSMPAGSVGLSMASLFALADGDRAKAAQLAQEARKEVKHQGEATLAVTASLLSQPSAPPDVWSARISQAVPDPRQATLRDELLGWALLLDRHYRESAAIWRRAADSTSTLTNNDQRILLIWSLAAGGQTEEARKAMSQGWLPPASPDPGLGALFYPKIVEIRTKL